MKKLVIALALSLTGCAQLSAISGDITPAANTVTMDAAKALIVAHNAYQGATAAALVAVNSGKLSHDQLATIRTLNDRGYSLLNGAGAGLSDAQRAASVLLIVTQLNSIVETTK